MNMHLRPDVQSVSGPLTVALAATTLLVCWGSGCTSYDDRIGLLLPEPPAFTTADASAAEVEAGLTAYCPASTCSAPFTTCPGSRFPCDVNLMTDPENCGSCGFKCPSPTPGASFACVAGKCAMECSLSHDRKLDCNGVLDDDCEVTLGTNDNCTACGDKCPDPAKPCIYDHRTGTGKCGCDAGLLFCGMSCIDPNVSDDHCGQCGNGCDPAGGGGDLETNMYYGCKGGTCDHLKCEPMYDDCDQNRSNGCETSLLAPTSCGACGVVCDPNQSCMLNLEGVPECLCPPGQTLCGPRCVDLRSDNAHCGACGVQCSQSATWTTGVSVCSYGSCRFQCAQGRGDCNGELRDGCEINLDSDPRNCGECGHTCAPGQPCTAGTCAVVPCDEGVEAR